MLLDLDHFKQVNDSYGHAVGDDALTRTVAICRQELRASDIFGRLGGEEFGILMPACSAREGIEISNRVREALASTPIRLGAGPAIGISASFGLASSADSSYEITQLLRATDTAMYRAKSAGRNQLVIAGNGASDDVASNMAAAGEASATRACG